MSDFAAFATARLDEDEAALRAVEDNSEPWCGQWAPDEANFALRTRNGWSLARAVTVEEGFPPGVLAHIVRHDPARALREVEAKRAILAEHRWDDMGWCTRCQTPLPDAREDEEKFAPVDWPCPTVRITFAVYSDHPDYQQEWKPSA
jgi:hypothetical protein